MTFIKYFNLRIAFISVMIIFSSISCSYNTISVATIRIKGSDTMLYLTRNLAEEYMKRNPGVSVYVEGGGTASGIRSFIKGEIDIATASRPLQAEEVKTLAEQYGSIGISFTIARDALSIYVNSKNSVKDFSLENIKNIFTCKTNNWQNIGGENKPILTIIRSPNSGTYLYFKEHLLGDSDYCDDALVKATTEGIIEEINNNENAISYGGIGYGEEVLHAKVNGIEPSEENVRNDTYPISRYLYFYTLNTPSGRIKDFINWVMTPEGQKIVKQSGYIPLFEITY
jgi:phosphate transport system substrate-binding protein